MTDTVPMLAAIEKAVDESRARWQEFNAGMRQVLARLDNLEQRIEGLEDAAHHHELIVTPGDVGHA